MDNVIASAELRVVNPDGSELPVLVAIGLPYLAKTGEWRCPVELRGLHGNLPNIAGEDSMQALCLAISLARNLLTDVREKGGKLLHASDPSEYPLDAVFGTVGDRTGT
jgi:hypothetical protein